MAERSSSEARHRPGIPGVPRLPASAGRGHRRCQVRCSKSCAAIATRASATEADVEDSRRARDLLVGILQRASWRAEGVTAPNPFSVRLRALARWARLFPTWSSAPTASPARRCMASCKARRPTPACPRWSSSRTRWACPWTPSAPDPSFRTRPLFWGTLAPSPDRGPADADARGTSRRVRRQVGLRHGLSHQEVRPDRGQQGAAAHGEDIRAYRCGVCGGFYHIGHHLSPEQLRERARRREASGRR